MEHVFLVVFDLDGVIVNTSSFHYRAWKRLLAEEWGVEHTQEVDDMTKGIGRYECLRLITQQYGLSVPETSFRALADRKNSYYVQLLHTELGPENILPGIPETFSPFAPGTHSHGACLVQLQCTVCGAKTWASF